MSPLLLGRSITTEVNNNSPFFLAYKFTFIAKISPLPDYQLKEYFQDMVGECDFIPFMTAC